MAHHYDDIRQALTPAPPPLVRFPVIPCPAPRMTQRDRWAKRPCVLRYYAYRDAVQAYAKERNFTLPPALDITFVVPMPPSWSARSKKATNGLAHQCRPDLDNLVKAFLDALAADDGYVWQLRADKRWGYEGQIVVAAIQEAAPMRHHEEA